MPLSLGKLFRAATRRWIGPFADARRIVKVTVRDEHSQVDRVLDSERDLAAFRALWAALIEADPRAWTPPPGGPYYKLAIQWVARGGRMRASSWLHYPDGFVKLLAIWRAVWVAPLYRTPSPGAFEAMLRPDRS